MKHVGMVVGLLCTVTFAAQAQARGEERGPDIPSEHRPPPGMCRIWIESVPPGQQPAPTDCSSAVRNRPANARVIFGDNYASPDRKKVAPPRGFARILPFARENNDKLEPKKREEKKQTEKPRDAKKPRRD